MKGLLLLFYCFEKVRFFLICFFYKKNKNISNRNTTIDRCYKVEPAQTPSQKHRSLPRLCGTLHRKTMQPLMASQAMRGLDLLHLLHQRFINPIKRKLAACISSCMSICIYPLALSLSLSLAIRWYSMFDVNVCVTHSLSIYIYIYICIYIYACIYKDMYVVHVCVTLSLSLSLHIHICICICI